MDHPTKKSHKTLFITTTLVLVWLLFLAGSFFIRSKYNFFPQAVENLTSSKEKIAFPDIDTSKLSETQQKIVTTLKKEYATQPSGLKYSGAQEPWCADFVSWVMKEVDEPLINPNTDSWRIPGTKTLRDYYEANQRFKLASEKYTPHVGDVVLYDNPSPYGEHVNFVLNYDNGMLTTIGGNEPGGIRVSTHNILEDPGFLGYGVLET